MSNFSTSAAVVASAVAAALVGALAIGSMPVLVGLAVTSALFAALVAVAVAAQSRRFDDANRAVYQPVYVRSRNVHRRVRSFDD